MKSLLCLLSLSAALLLPARAAGDTPAASASPTPNLEGASARSVLRKAVEPVVDLFAHTADGPNHAWSLRIRLAETNVHPPELQGTVFNVRLLTAPDLLVHDLDPATRQAIAVGWDLLVRAAPHLEI